MIIIAPNRYDPITLQDREPTQRFADFIDDIVQTVNSLAARSINTQDSNYTFLLTDSLSIVRKTSSTTSQTYTIPSNDSVAFELGQVLEVQNDGSVDLDIEIDTDTLTFEDDGTTGTRTIAADGSGRFVKVANTDWKCRGKQMT